MTRLARSPLRRETPILKFPPAVKSGAASNEVELVESNDECGEGELGSDGGGIGFGPPSTR